MNWLKVKPIVNNTKSLFIINTEVLYKLYKLNKLESRVVFKSLLLLAFCSVFAMPTFSQDDFDDRPKDLAPPPLNVITKGERKQLKTQTKLKKRTKLALQLMEARLVKSEELFEKNEFQNSLDELGRYQGILINQLNYLKDNQRRKASLKHFKKLEMSLRSTLPRLEILRREMPFKYSYHVKQIMLFIRKYRTEALNPLFADTVLPEGNN